MHDHKAGAAPLCGLRLARFLPALVRIRVPAISASRPRRSLQSHAVPLWSDQGGELYHARHSRSWVIIGSGPG